MNNIIKECKNYGTINTTKSSSGGICGWASDITFTNCFNYGTVNSEWNYVGGIVGRSDCVNGSVYVKNCENQGDITGNNYVGGIVGSSVNGLIEINACINEGNVIGQSYIGGIIGSTELTNVEDCINYGNASGNGNTGGIVGRVLSAGNVTWCKNYGNITDTRTDCGGIIGSVGPDAPCEVKYCLNEGDIKGYVVMGGIVGGTVSELTISYSYASCKITNTWTEKSAGGIIGYWMPNTSIHHVFFVGTSEGDVHPFHATKWDSSWIETASYSVMNSTKVYRDGDFSTFQVIPGINQGYPVMSELFSIVQEPNGTAVLDFFSKNGFSRI